MDYNFTEEDVMKLELWVINSLKGTRNIREITVNKISRTFAWID
jgi:hypothetical protein